MTLSIELPAAIEAILREDAASNGQATGEYISALAQELLFMHALRARSERHRQQSLDELKPPIPPPPGTNGMAAVFGQWPGDETTEELLAALREIS